MSGGVSMGAILTAVGASVAGAVVSSALSKKSASQAQSTPMLMEAAPAAATQDNTRKAAEDAAAQAKKRAMGASGRSDTIKTGGANDLGSVGGAGGGEQKTLLGY